MKNNFHRICMCFIIIFGFIACPFQNPEVPAPSGNPAPPIIPGLELLYCCVFAEPEYNQISPYFNIVNNSTQDIELTQIVIRYYFTKEGFDEYYFWCDYAKIGNKNITYRRAANGVYDQPCWSYSPSISQL